MRAMVADEWGRLFVADVKEQQIRLFDNTGRFIRTFGRRGAGPGEFSNPVGLAMPGGNELFVYDPGQWRVSVFDTSGALRAGYRAHISSWGPTWNGGIAADGRLVDKQQRVNPGDSAVHHDVRVLDLATGREERFPFPTCGFREPVVFLPGGVVAAPFSARGVSAIDPRGGTWCYHTSRAVAYWVPFGDTLARDSAVSEAAPAHVESVARDSARRLLERNVRLAGGSRRLLDSLEIPRVRPVLLAVTTDRDRRLWMMIRDERGVALHAFDSSRRWIARVRLPVDVIEGRPPLITRDAVFVLSVNEFDEPVIHRLKLPVALRRP
ncbi:MAG: 6-bladed beta-propeller [Gemmatimonadaceae bacterium]|nr:6-bladed beta-propeller [Gemmatimonadaceae bacterium]